MRFTRALLQAAKDKKPRLAPLTHGETNFVDLISDIANRKTKGGLNPYIVLGRHYDGAYIRNSINQYRRNKEIERQNFNPIAHHEYGPDLAATRFTISMGGRVRTSLDVEEWKTKKHKWSMPKEFDPDFKLCGVNLTKTELLHEGLRNFIGLNHLVYMNISQNPDMDDHSCDMLARQFRDSNSLKYVDVSFNPTITIHGIESLLRIPTIKTIMLRATAASRYEHIDYIKLLVEDQKNCSLLTR